MSRLEQELIIDLRRAIWSMPCCERDFLGEELHDRLMDYFGETLEEEDDDDESKYDDEI